MKAERIEPRPKFQPVSLMLETQEEVDAVYALFNISPLIESVGLNHPWETLVPFRNGVNGTRLYIQAIKCLRKGGF